MNKSHCVFVGNIPYDVTEPQLREIFERVGPVVAFRLVLDKDTKVPKGFGFCEYRDAETALSAMRNLNNVEVNGRQLRVDWSENEAGASFSQLNQPRAYGAPRDTNERAAQTDVMKAVYSMPMENLKVVLASMQAMIEDDPLAARQLLVEKPVLAYALHAAHHRYLVRTTPVQPVTPDELRPRGSSRLMNALMGGPGM